jgi:hypothetical protein
VPRSKSSRKSYSSKTGHPGKKNKETLEKEAREMKKAPPKKGSPKKTKKKLPSKR